MGSTCVTVSWTFVRLSINKGVIVLESVKGDRVCEKVLELSRVIELGVSILLEVRRSSSSCSPDWRSPSSSYVYRTRDSESYQIHWIKEVHRERSGQQPVSSWYQSPRFLGKHPHIWYHLGIRFQHFLGKPSTIHPIVEL